MYNFQTVEKSGFRQPLRPSVYLSVCLAVAFPANGRREVCEGDRQTGRHADGLSKTTFLDVLKVVHPKSGLISTSIFCTMPIPPLTWK